MKGNLRKIMIDKTREIALKILYKIDKEKAYSNIVLNEMIKQNSELYVKLLAENIYMVTESHEKLKMYSKDVKAIIRTGEATPYANVILSSGVLF